MKKTVLIWSMLCFSVYLSAAEVSVDSILAGLRRGDRNAPAMAESFVAAADSSGFDGLSDTVAAELYVAAADYLSDKRFLFSKAIERQEVALGIFDTLGDEYRISVSKYKLARYYFEIEEYHRTLQYAYEACAYFEKSGNTEEMLDCYNVLGAAYMVCGDYDRTAEYFDYVRMCSQNMHDTLRLQTALNNIEVYLKIIGNIDSAEVVANQLLNLCIDLRDTVRICARYLNSVSTYINYGMYDEAVMNLDSSRIYMTTLRDSARYYHFRGLLNMVYEDVDDAERNLTKALTLYRRGDFYSLMLHCLNALYYLYDSQNRHDKAYEILQQCYEYRTSRPDIEVIKELFWTRDEILTSAEREIMEEHRNRRILLSVILFFLLVIASMVVVYIFRRKNERIRQGEKEIGIRNEILEMKEMQAYRMDNLTNVVTTRLNELTKASKDENLVERIREIRQEIDSVMDNGSWKDYTLMRPEYNSVFLQHLLEVHPKLTVNERRLCIFLHHNLSSKEISAITHQSVDSINKARTRLRRKLGLMGEDTTIQEYLSKFD